MYVSYRLKKSIFHDFYTEKNCLNKYKEKNIVCTKQIIKNACQVTTIFTKNWHFRFFEAFLVHHWVKENFWFMRNFFWVWKKMGNISSGWSLTPWNGPHQNIKKNIFSSWIPNIKSKNSHFCNSSSILPHATHNTFSLLKFCHLPSFCYSNV